MLTWVFPLHAIGEGLVGDEVVSARSGVGDEDVCGCRRGHDGREKSRAEHFVGCQDVS